MSNTMVTTVKDIMQRREQETLHTVLPSEPITAVMASQMYQRQRGEELVKKIEINRILLQTATYGLSSEEINHSMFGEVMEYSANQKANEAVYREIVLKGVSLYSDETRYPDEFKNLVAYVFLNGKIQSRNPKEYNDIIEKAEIFHNIINKQSSETLLVEEGVLVDVAFELSESCEKFINKYSENPAYEQPVCLVRKELDYALVKMREKKDTVLSSKMSQMGHGRTVHEWGSETEGTKTVKKLIMLEIKKEINDWKPAGQIEQTNLVTSIKEKINTSENISRMLPMVFATQNYVEAERLGQIDNYLNEGIFSTTKSHFDSLWEGFVGGLKQTMGDIYFWGTQKNITRRENSTDEEEILVSDIELKGSDVHERGLGVCLVTYSTGKFFALKPDVREFEYKAFRDSGNSDDGSFVEQYNARFANSLNVGKLPTIKMYIAGRDDVTGSEHGTLVQGLDKLFRKRTPKCETPDEQLVDDTKVLEPINTSALLVASLLGIGDLHPENMQYQQKEDTFVPFFVDADVMIQFQHIGNPNSAGGLGGFANKTNMPLLSSKMLDDLANFAADFVMANKRRITPFDTSALLNKRVGFLENVIYSQGKEGQFFNNFWDEFKAEIEKYFDGLDRIELSEQHKRTFISWHKKDYLNGKVPFYEFDPITGNITTHGEVVGVVTAFKKGDSETEEQASERKKKMISEQIKVGFVDGIISNYGATIQVPTTHPSTEREILLRMVRAGNERVLELLVDTFINGTPESRNSIKEQVRNVLFPSRKLKVD